MLWSIPKIWSGHCWILGGGVSVSEQFGVPETLIPTTREEYYEFGSYLSSIMDDHVIGVNVGAFVSDAIEVAFWGDSDTYSDFRSWYDAFGGIKVSAAGKFADKRFPSIYHVYKNNKKGITTKTDEVSWVAKNSASAAISLAHHLGCRQIFLLGIDLKETNGRVHWHSGYPDKRATPTIKNGHKGIPTVESPVPFKRHMENYHFIARDAEKVGLKIWNVSPTSALECFEKIDLQTALKTALNLTKNTRSNDVN
jgi:hypothetical protein